VDFPFRLGLGPGNRLHEHFEPEVLASGQEESVLPEGVLDNLHRSGREHGAFLGRRGGGEEVGKVGPEGPEQLVERGQGGAGAAFFDGRQSGRGHPGLAAEFTEPQAGLLSKPGKAAADILRVRVDHDTPWLYLFTIPNKRTV